MSIFRETFEPFVKDELKRRQAGMLTRNPSFLHQLNSRSAWVRMTSGVNVNNSNDLAKKYVLQGGILNVNTVTQGDKVTDIFALKSGLGGASNAYSNTTAGGAINRLGIKPMPGITNVSIQSKGAYGSLQEATVSFVCWDIRQLEELELLYMRPGYTVLFEMGWDYAKANGELPRYDILNKKDLVLNDGFKEIYNLIEQSKGNYNALLGYVKNYNWSARDDGGYDCTTSIISLGEVLESLKCNWVPINTKAFDRSGKGLLGLTSSPTEIPEAYKQGIIPGLLRELHNYITSKFGSNFEVVDGDIRYYLFRKQVGNGRPAEVSGLNRPLGKGSKYENYITLQSFCDLLNKHVLLTDEKDNPLVQITTNEQLPNGEITNEPLKCIASPLSLSTNLGVCYIENPNWESLEIQTPPTTSETTTTVLGDVLKAINARGFGWNSGTNPNNVYKRFAGSITKTEFTPPITGVNIVVEAITALTNRKKFYTYKSSLGLQGDIDKLATDLGNALTRVEYVSVKDQDGNTSLRPKFFFINGSSFTSTTSNTNSISVLDYFGDAEAVYRQLFNYDYDNNGKLEDTSLNSVGFIEDPFEESDSPVKDNKGTSWTKQSVINAIQKALSNVPINPVLQKSLEDQAPQVANQIAEQASQAGEREATKKFLVPVNGNSQRQLGNIGNIYLNLDYLYDKAISRNLASGDTQTKNTISIRDFLQDVLRDVQNSIGNLNTFDIQVDDRNSIGRIIDINSTQNPSSVKDELFELQIHNLNSCVRNYAFQSKIFPEMGSIIAISAQDPGGIGTLGYDNATLVAWNEGISDRLIPKRLTNPNDLLSEENDVVTYILPFLTQMWEYFNVISGKASKDDINLAYGGLNFAFRDFLAHLDKTNAGNNKFKTIIPTELNITLDGIGGIIIGNLFKINEDIVPKGYRGVLGRKLAYIVTKLGHTITDNDWTTQLSAYPIVFEQSTGEDVWKQWDNDQYPRTIIRAGGTTLRLDRTISTCNFNQTLYSEAVNFFINKGYSKEATAAAVGSFLQESQLNPNIVNYNDRLNYNDSEQTYAAGIAQWVGPRRVKLLQYAKSKGISIPNYNEAIKVINNSTKKTNSRDIIRNAFSNMNLKTQLEWADQEMKTYPGYSDFKTSTNLNSTILWMYVTYGGGNFTAGAAIGNREGYAIDILNRLNGKPCGSAAPTITSTTQTNASQPSPSKPAPSNPAPSPSLAPRPTPTPTPSAVSSWKAGEYVVTGTEQKNGVIIQYDVIKDTTVDYYTIRLKNRNAEVLEEFEVGPTSRQDAIARAKQSAEDLL